MVLRSGLLYLRDRSSLLPSAVVVCRVVSFELPRRTGRRLRVRALPSESVSPVDCRLVSRPDIYPLGQRSYVFWSWFCASPKVDRMGL